MVSLIKWKRLKEATGRVFAFESLGVDFLEDAEQASYTDFYINTVIECEEEIELNYLQISNSKTLKEYFSYCLEEIRKMLDIIIEDSNYIQESIDNEVDLSKLVTMLHFLDIQAEQILQLSHWMFINPMFAKTLKGIQLKEKKGKVDYKSNNVDDYSEYASYAESWEDWKNKLYCEIELDLNELKERSKDYLNKLGKKKSYFDLERNKIKSKTSVGIKYSQPIYALMQVYLSISGEGDAVTNSNKNTIAKRFGYNGHSFYQEFLFYLSASQRTNLIEKKTMDKNKRKNFEKVIELLKGYPIALSRAIDEFKSFEKLFENYYK